MIRVLSYLKRLKKMPPFVGNSFQEKLYKFQTYSKSELRALNRLYVLAKDVISRNIPGDFVECGVWNGGSAATIAYGLLGSDKKAWLYDSFAGMPNVSDIDGPLAANYVGKVVGEEEKVREVMKIAGISTSSYIIKKGWFQETFQENLPGSISFLHIDSDWYDSVLICLETMYDLVSDGGVVVLDDFGCWEGCREAFYDFSYSRGIKPLLERHGYTAAFWIKGRAHNRDFMSQWEIP